MTDWIKVKDEPPKWYEWVDVWSDYYKTPMRARRVETGNGGWKWDWSKYVGLIDMSVKYWMPLAESPEPIEATIANCDVELL